MAPTIQNKTQALEAYQEIIKSLRNIKMALSMHTDVFKEALKIRKEQKKWPTGLFKSLKAVVTKGIENILIKTEVLEKSTEKINITASEHLKGFAGKITVWFNEVMTGDVITSPKSAWAQLMGATLENFLETVRADLVKLAIKDKLNRDFYVNLNREITDEFNKFRQEAFKEVHAGI